MTSDNLDGIAVEDVERIFGGKTTMTLEEIHSEMGQRIMGIWIESGYRKAVRDEVPLYQFPQFVTEYIFQRYEQANGGGE